MTIKTLSFLILAFIFSGKTREKQEVPYPDLEVLDKLTPLNEHRVARGKRVVLINTFAGCKPCQYLAKKLNKHIEKGQFSSGQVGYINSVDYDLKKLEKTLHISAYPCAYYLASFHLSEMSYPGIWAYDTSGKLAWVLEGYSRGNWQKIDAFLSGEN